MRSRRAAGPRLWPVAALAALLLGVSFACLQLWLEQGRLADLPVYQGYADLMRAGHVPYRDFSVEYPPAALPGVPAALVPALELRRLVRGADGALRRRVPRRRGVDPALRRRLAGARTAALLLVGVSPLALGSLFDTRFDLWPALLAVASLAALLDDRPLLSGGLGGLAFAAKLWPAVLAPLGLAYLWRRRGPRATGAAVAGFAVVAAACFLPFAALAPGGVWHSVVGQLDRPLQVESLGAAVLMAAEHFGGPTLATVTSHGSQALSGSAAGPVAAVSAALQVLVVAAIWIAFARRRRPGPETLLLACAAAVAALVAFGKFFSPQFLIWLVPFVPLVRGLRGAIGSAFLVAALVLTSAWFPDHYWTLALGHSSPWSWLLLARDLSVVALAAVLAWPARLQHEALGENAARLEALQTIRGQIQ